MVVGIDALLLLLGPDGALWRRTTRGDVTQQVFSVTIEQVNPATNTIRVVGDLVGIMGMDITVPPQTWIGIDRQLAVFAQLRDGLRANISFVRHGEQRTARWIAASSGPSPGLKPTETGAPGAAPPGASLPGR